MRSVARPWLPAAIVAAIVCACAAGRIGADAAPAEGEAGAGICDPAKFKIAIDVGHTAEAGGATSARGVAEFIFNLKLAGRIEAALTAAGFDHSHLLVSRGRGRSQLLARSARANALGVDLLVSIHHDSVQDSYLAKWQFDGRTRLFSDKFDGYSLFVSFANAHLAESQVFAALLADELMARGMHFTTHHAEDIPGERRELIDPNRGIYRYDELLVLKNTTAPAVLFEAGVIVNRAEELVLTSPRRQQLVSAAMLAAVRRFCVTSP